MGQGRCTGMLREADGADGALGAPRVEREWMVYEKVSLGSVEAPVQWLPVKTSVYVGTYDLRRYRTLSKKTSVLFMLAMWGLSVVLPMKNNSSLGFHSF
ncbi:hypothetical protein K439DRAFT_413361 [Ramaria rubella]|nr:hypothetical protein K439DRAFT_413361 [Ramaria rubella]